MGFLYSPKSDGATKKKILKTIFGEKQIVVNGNVTALSSQNPYNSSFELVIS